MSADLAHPNLWWLILATNVLSTIWLAACVLRWKYLLLKPSIIFIGYYQISIMWPAISWYKHMLNLVSDPLAYVVALHIFGLAATIVATCTWHKSAQALSARIGGASGKQEKNSAGTIILLTGILFAISSWYLYVVGWRNTGLYAIVSGSEDIAQAREDSLKLIVSPILRYGWVFATCSIAYLLAHLLATTAVRAIAKFNFATFALAAAGYSLILLVVMLPGARAPAAMVLLTSLFSYYVATGFRRNPALFCLLGASGLIIPAFLSLLREQQNITLANLTLYYFDIFDRFAGRSIEDNIWMVSYVQEKGFFGTAGIPVLSRIAGVESINIFNIVGLHFLPNGIQSISANTAFPVVNYACFGASAIWLSLGLTFAMDGLLWLQSGLPRYLLVPSCGICAIISLNFAMTMFTTVFITHGLVLTVFTCYVLHFLGQMSRSAQVGSDGAAHGQQQTP